ncbi:HYR domain-containing protein, partial [Agromyces sp. NPDC058110]|uniref:HYR domain-containing protein n=1 Tax=Agromyces sp. NPDC058110 TaxID=3346345 RepID=UPI0036DABC3F
LLEGIVGSPPPGFDVAITDGSATVTIVDDETEDTIAPTVTIEQGGSQDDPALVTSQPVVFDVVFSEPVTGFVNTDVVLSGSGNPTMAVVVPVSATEYTVQVSGAVAGEVVAEVAAGAAEDAAGNLSEASTSVDNKVMLEDIASPDPLTITAPDDLVVDVPFGETGANVDFDAPTTTGGVAPITVDCDATSGDFFPIGVTTVTCTATDSAPPEQVVLFAVVSDTFTITVVEGEEPPGEEPPPTTGPTDPGTTPGGTNGGSGTAGSGSNGSGGMAPTGVDAAPMILLGLALMLAGAAAVRFRGRRAAASARR